MSRPTDLFYREQYLRMATSVLDAVNGVYGDSADKPDLDLAPEFERPETHHSLSTQIEVLETYQQALLTWSAGLSKQIRDYRLTLFDMNKPVRETSGGKTAYQVDSLIDQIERAVYHFSTHISRRAATLRRLLEFKDVEAIAHGQIYDDENVTAFLREYAKDLFNTPLPVGER